MGKKRSSATISQLAELGLIQRTYELERIKVKTRQVPYVRLVISNGKTLEIAENLTKKAPKQAALLNLLSTQSGPISLAEVKFKANCDKTTTNALIRKELVQIEYVEVRREPLSGYQIQLSQPLNLTTAQEAVFKPIQSSLRNKHQEPILRFSYYTALQPAVRPKSIFRRCRKRSNWGKEALRWCRKLR